MSRAGGKRSFTQISFVCTVTWSRRLRVNVKQKQVNVDLISCGEGKPVQLLVTRRGENTVLQFLSVLGCSGIQLHAPLFSASLCQLNRL
ncbi:hypothetical protein J6590_074445 [Homalodisca vitripennis]|nr:hypothetical protein J6590_074445 [Homalodisca vitripennis]